MRRESSRADILAFNRQGLRNTEIADEVGCTRHHVSGVLRAEGIHQRTKRPNRFRGQEKVDLFKTDPMSFDTATRLTPWATHRILFETKELLNDNHLAAGAHIEGCVRLFQARKQSAVTGAMWVRANCDLVTATGLKADWLRRKRRLEDAIAIIDSAIAAAEGRVCCVAEAYRRKALILLAQRRGSEALSAVNSAKRLYEEEIFGTGASHHNLNGKPLEACLVGRATIHFYMGDFRSGQKDSAEALRTIVPKETPVLYRNAVTALAWCLIKSGEVEEARGLCSELEKNFEFDLVPSVSRAATRWLSGMIDALDGDIGAADDKYREALADFVWLEMPKETTTLVVDRERLLADPLMTKSRIGGSLTELRDGRRRYFRFLRAFVRPLGHLCRSAEYATYPVFQHILSEIRDFAGGAFMMPAPRTQL